jgi:hypothetical protein
MNEVKRMEERLKLVSPWVNLKKEIAKDVFEDTVQGVHFCTSRYYEF